MTESTRGKRIPGLVSKGTASGDESQCYIETGSYTGDGEISKVVSLVDTALIVKYILITMRLTTHQQYSQTFSTSDVIVDDIANGAAFTYTASSTVHQIYQNTIIALGTGSFTVDDSAADWHPNKNGQVYNYVVMGTH